MPPPEPLRPVDVVAVAPTCRAGAKVEAGRVLKVTPHSGHYVPTQAEYDSLVAEWRRDGLDLSEAAIGGFVKVKT